MKNLVFLISLLFAVPLTAQQNVIIDNGDGTFDVILDRLDEDATTFDSAGVVEQIMRDLDLLKRQQGRLERRSVETRREANQLEKQLKQFTGVNSIWNDYAKTTFANHIEGDATIKTDSSSFDVDIELRPNGNIRVREYGLDTTETIYTIDTFMVFDSLDVDPVLDSLEVIDTSNIEYITEQIVLNQGSIVPENQNEFLLKNWFEIDVWFIKKEAGKFINEDNRKTRIIRR